MDVMTEQLTAVFAEASQLPPEQQDALAAIILNEIDADRQWEELFARLESHEFLGRLADEALAEHHAGRTRRLDVNDR
jgi:hypothetical protein